MGKYSNGANGVFSGKVGSVIGSSWRSVNYLRGLPKKSSKSASPSQLAQQAKFAMSATYLRPIKDVLNIGFGDKRLNKITGYNAAVKSFLTNAVVGDYPAYSVDFSKCQFSRGSLNPFTAAKVEYVATDLVFTWKSILNNYNSHADDSLIFIVFNETKNMYLLYDEVERAAETYNAVLGDTFVGDVLQTWIFGVDRDRLAVSSSQYLGSLTIPL